VLAPPFAADQLGSGFPTVSEGNDRPFSPNLPISITPTPMGLGVHSVFASEFGAVGMSSFESMGSTLNPEHWGL
jgi:hypothetical protein